MQRASSYNYIICHILDESLQSSIQTLLCFHPLHLPPTELRIDTSHLWESWHELVCICKIRWFAKSFSDKLYHIQWQRILMVSHEFFLSCQAIRWVLTGWFLPCLWWYQWYWMSAGPPPVSYDILPLNEVLCRVMSNRGALLSLIWHYVWVLLSNAWMVITLSGKGCCSWPTSSGVMRGMLSKPSSTDGCLSILSTRLLPNFTISEANMND